MFPWPVYECFTWYLQVINLIDYCSNLLQPCFDVHLSNSHRNPHQHSLIVGRLKVIGDMGSSMDVDSESNSWMDSSGGPCPLHGLGRGLTTKNGELQTSTGLYGQSQFSSYGHSILLIQNPHWSVWLTIQHWLLMRGGSVLSRPTIGVLVNRKPSGPSGLYLVLRFHRRSSSLYSAFLNRTSTRCLGR